MLALYMECGRMLTRVWGDCVHDAWYDYMGVPVFIEL
jgi:hypothetical protein